MKKFVLTLVVAVALVGGLVFNAVGNPEAAGDTITWGGPSKNITLSIK